MIFAASPMAAVALGATLSAAPAREAAVRPPERIVPASQVAITAGRIMPRHDLVRASVVIKYLVRSSDNGRERLDYLEDRAPAGASGRELGCLMATIDLRGAQRQVAEVEIVTEPVAAAAPEAATRCAWWAAHLEAEFSPRLRNIRLEEVRSTQSDPTLTREVLVGPVPRWTGFRTERATFSALLFAEYAAADGTTLAQLGPKEISVSVTVTDAPSGLYRSLQRFEAGDPVPRLGAGGLAEYLHQATRELPWEGSITLTEEEAGGAAGLGHLINLAGGRPEWAAMNALVQTVEIDVDRGQTRLTFGPPEHLGPSDLVELLKVGRARQRWTRAETYEDGGDAPEALDNAGRDALVNGVPGNAQLKLLTVYDPAAGQIKADAGARRHVVQTNEAANPKRIESSIPQNGGGVGSPRLDLVDGTSRVEIDTALCNGRRLYIRECEVCVNNQVRRALVLMSEPY